MAVIANQNQNREKRDYFQDCFNPGTLTAVRPKTSSVTIFRPLPEFDAAGNMLPMVKALTAMGPDFSNVTTEETVINTGVSTKFSGLCRASDSDAQDAINMVFPSLYIKLTSRMKRGEIQADMLEKVRALLEEKSAPGGNSKIKHRLLERSQSTGFLQGVATTVNGKALERPAAKQALVMSSNLCAIMSKVLEEAHKNKIDVFNPEKGNALIIKGLGPDPTVGRTVNVYVVEIGKVLAVSAAKAKELWVPWETAFKRQTLDQQLAQAIRCFGKDVVALVYPDDVARLTAVQATRPVSGPAPATQHTTAATVAASAGPEDLDLSNAQIGAVDDGGDEHADEAGAASDASKPAGADELASGYDNLLKSL
jgi:hypothetical protein